MSSVQNTCPVCLGLWVSFTIPPKEKREMVIYSCLIPEFGRLRQKSSFKVQGQPGLHSESQDTSDAGFLCFVSLLR